MKQQEKKKREGNRRRQTQSTSSFPPDLTSEILSRLPLKSIVRFRSVSKLWSSTSTDPYFINSLETQSSTRPSLLLCATKGVKLFVSSIPQHTQDSNKPYSSSLPMKLPERYLSFTESVHGLICFQALQKSIVGIWNPSMRSFLTLPNPNNHKIWKNVRLFLGYDPIEGKHKVMCLLFGVTCEECQVLTLGSAQESWRTVKTNHEHRAYFDIPGRYINGVIYYLATDPKKTNDLAVMSFDVRSEKFNIIDLPSNIDEGVLITYEGKLACIDDDNDRRLWILEDAEKHKWSSQDFLVPLRHNDPNLVAGFSLIGFTHAGEFIYVPEDSFHRRFYILFFDPVSNSCRRFEFKGIPDEESCRNKYELHVFPNHIESLIIPKFLL